MKVVIGLVIACLLLNISCNRKVSYEEALSENREEFEDADKLEDAKFLVESKSRNMLSTELLKLASDSGYSSVVVNFASQTLPEHRKLGEEIIDLSKKKDVLLPDEMSGKHKILLSQLTSATRHDFDKTFTNIISRMNEENNSIFTTYATQAADPDVRAFAARKLGVVRAHSKLVSALESQLLDTE